MRQILLSALVASIVAIALFVGLQLVVNQSASGAAGSGYTHYQTENFLQGFYAGTQGQFKITNAGVVSSSAAMSFGGEVTLSNCGTASFTIPALSGTLSNFGDSYASTTVTVSGMAVGDMVLVSIGTSTRAAHDIAATGFASSGIAIVNFDNLLAVTSTAITTTTITACYFD